MADKCACCGIVFSASVPRNHIGGYQFCDTCKKMIDKNDISGSIEKIREEKRERAEKLKEKEENYQRILELKQRKKEMEENKKRKAKERFLSTSGYNFEGYQIIKYLNVASGEVVLGTGFFAESDASVSDFCWETSKLMASKLTRAKELALEKLVSNCVERGANAVIGVDLDYMTIKNNMIVACANGTAVVIEKIEDK